MTPEIQHLYGHHKPKTPEHVKEIEASRRCFAVFAEFIESLPSGREKACAKTKLEECSFWANAAIARAWGPAEPIQEASQ